MRALVCSEFAPLDALAVGELPDPQPAPGHVVVDVKAAGLNFPDVLCVQGLYQFKPELPFAPGQEGAGVVAAIGEGVGGLAVGDRVAFVVLAGAIAERIAIPAVAAIRLPDTIDFETAAAFTMAYGTSYHALVDRAALKAGETVLVLGASGGVGLAAVEIAKARGARVIAAASSAEKLAVCRDHGADETVNYADEDLKARVKELTGKSGANVIYDPVGGTMSEAALRAIAWEGRFLVVGFAAGAIPKIPLNLTLLKSCQIMGVFWGAWLMRTPAGHAANMAALFELLAAGALKPLVSERFDLDHAVDGLRALAERRAVGKLVVTIG